MLLSLNHTKKWIFREYLQAPRESKDLQKIGKKRPLRKKQYKKIRIKATTLKQANYYKKYVIWRKFYKTNKELKYNIKASEEHKKIDQIESPDQKSTKRFNGYCRKFNNYFVIIGPGLLNNRLPTIGRIPKICF